MGHPVPGGLEGGGEGRLEQRGIRWQGGEDGAEGASAAGQRRRQEPGLQRREERQVGEGVGPHQAETGGGSGGAREPAAAGRKFSKVGRLKES